MSETEHFLLDSIRELRAENANMKSVLSAYLNDEREQLRAENERLTARLKEAMADLQQGALIILAMRAENEQLRAEIELVSK